MSSSRPIPSQTIHNVDEDDDEFDWAAAVREIDVACQSGGASTSNPCQEGRDSVDLRVTGNGIVGFSRPQVPKRTSAAPRQLTLDKFVKGVARRPDVGSGSSGQQRVEEEGNNGDGSGDWGPCYCEIDLEAAKTWIYPVNIPLRDYQLSITRTALFSNTLVALPTGLGKTLIAAVVMYNYFRWFPSGKIVFTAPSRPLVMQQIEACHNIVGIPQDWTIDMTGQINPSNRARFWETKRVFFVTPQVLEKDIQSGTCIVKQLVCLVIDEAHRALGNYSYCVAVRELLAVPVQLRILALTATPGSKQQTIQTIINNLCISKLEYRNESDHDVSRYVHDRKLELIQVPMGKDAVEINNLLLQVIKPFVSRLCAFGLLHNRDFQTLSPCDLLNSRDKFRQVPPLELPHIRYGEIEGYFGVLITLYHIRKLLSSHGIRPAYEMLEEKLQQGESSFYDFENYKRMGFSRYLRFLFTQIPFPETNNPKSSRVHLSKSRDIMDSLANIEDSVKATEFIGQSSGKALKGQTQKVQQAVLQKFRAGGYNVIVATSIGEEGLDIMEVDLVICFDANVSPLRMIQRMGRTGRKHDGRVDILVLSCEGSELKGYLRKQATGKAVKKHMRNGGMNSFDFHSSPRMIPHICKPDVQFVEMSIEEFVPRGKKVKSDQMHRLAFKEKMSLFEADLLAKYFNNCEENAWKPSLVAFPHFQAFPSRVHNVIHSFRTGMLIDAIQHLQGLSFGEDNEMLQVDISQGICKIPVVGRMSDLCVGTETNYPGSQSLRDLVLGSPEAHSQIKNLDFAVPFAMLSNCKEEKCVPIVSGHYFLFQTEFVSLDISGKVSIASVPSLRFAKESSSHSESIAMKKDLCPNTKSCGDHVEPAKAIEKLTNLSMAKCVNHDVMLYPSVCKSQSREERIALGVETVLLQTPRSKGDLMNPEDQIFETPERIPLGFETVLLQTPSSKGNLMNPEDQIIETLDSVRRNTLKFIGKESSIHDFKDVEMSPRLTNMVEKGVVPESPIDCQDKSSPTVKSKVMETPADHEMRVDIVSLVTLAKAGGLLPPKELHSDGRDKLAVSSTACQRGCSSASPKNYNIIKADHHSGSPVTDEIRTPLINLTSNCSKEWYMSSGDALMSIQQVPKLKRLRKYGESCRVLSSNRMKENVSGPITSRSKSSAGARPGSQKRATHAELFIENEAEVSSDAEVSDDEEEKECDSFDGSFIDDRTCPETASTQAEAGRNDMMAIYR
ncbi:hypothetical protein Sjap_021461 [Stephania japonica]|uniref:Fanconi anemia group M protein n=1 Tax=Stephania japonica TaxID=461633 RepID=A0AAP0EVV0_9MAGN